MLILYSPVRNDKEILYVFEGETITAELNGVTDLFDFSVLGEGDTIINVETTLDINPIIHATREDGVLKVELVYYHGRDASEEERFPEWMEVE